MTLSRFGTFKVCLDCITGSPNSVLAAHPLSDLRRPLCIGGVIEQSSQFFSGTGSGETIPGNDACEAQSSQACSVVGLVMGEGNNQHGTP